MSEAKVLKKSDLDMILDLKTKGIPNRKIAEDLNKKGYRTKMNRPVCAASVSHFLIDQGYRQRQHMHRKQKTKSTEEPKSLFVEFVKSVNDVLKSTLDSEVKLFAIDGIVNKKLQSFNKPE